MRMARSLVSIVFIVLLFSGCEDLLGPNEIDKREKSEYPNGLERQAREKLLI